MPLPLQAALEAIALEIGPTPKMALLEHATEVPEVPKGPAERFEWTRKRAQHRYGGIADRFRDGRVFLCGDAAHIWVPNAGYGMNAGIADAMNLSWMLAGVLKGWASPAILSCYEIERMPITEQVEIDGAAGPQPQRLEHGEIARQPDREGREDEMERDGEGELQSG